MPQLEDREASADRARRSAERRAAVRAQAHERAALRACGESDQQMEDA